MMQDLKNRFLVKDWKTTLLGVAIILFTTWAFLEDKITWEQAAIGWHTGLGLIMAKDTDNRSADDNDTKNDSKSITN